MRQHSHMLQNYTYLYLPTYFRDAGELHLLDYLCVLEHYKKKESIKKGNQHLNTT